MCFLIRTNGTVSSKSIARLVLYPVSIIWLFITVDNKSVWLYNIHIHLRNGAANMSNVAQINTLIMTGGLSNDELNSVADALKYMRARIAKRNVWTLVKGVKVKWTSSKTGMTMSGTINKVNRKFMIVGVGTTNWRVPANMLSAA